MNSNQQEDLRPYRLYFGLSLLQFLGSLGLIGILATIVCRYFFSVSIF